MILILRWYQKVSWYWYWYWYFYYIKFLNCTWYFFWDLGDIINDTDTETETWNSFLLILILILRLEILSYRYWYWYWDHRVSWYWDDIESLVSPCCTQFFLCQKIFCMQIVCLRCIFSPDNEKVLLCPSCNSSWI